MSSLWGAPLPLKNEVSPSEPPPLPQLKREVPFHEMIPTPQWGGEAQPHHVLNTYGKPCI